MLRPPVTLVVCARCSRHVKSEEADCPHCGERLAGRGALRRTAAAVVMGLTAATALSSELVACAVYGVACSHDNPVCFPAGVGGAGGAGGATATGATGTSGTGGELNLLTGTGSTGGTGAIGDAGTGGMVGDGG